MLDGADEHFRGRAGNLAIDQIQPERTQHDAEADQAAGTPRSQTQAFGGGMPDADSLAMGIALQDVPEGLVIAVVLAGEGMSRVNAFLIGAASGLVEPVFAVLCAWLVSLAEVLLPLGLALAAGAMLLVVTHEVIPESRRNGHEKLASLGLCIGFCLMMLMDTALG